MKTTTLSQKKPIQLLQALVALGGKQVSKTRLENIFWPESNGDEQAAALKITLHRLRRILGVRDAIIQTSVHLSLNASLCWVDTWQFERLANETLIAKNLTRQERSFVADKAMHLYHDEFLSAYQNDSWIFSFRAKLHKIYQDLQSSKDL